MTKDDLSSILHATTEAINEWTASEKNSKIFPHIVYWPYVDADIVASDESYANQRTYQISIYAQIPDDPVILKLRDKLREQNLHPVIYHEYVEEDKVFHSYFALDVVEE